MFLLPSETRRISGLRVVLTMGRENLSFFSRSTVVIRTLPTRSFIKKKAITQMVVRVWLRWLIPLLMVPAIGFNTYLWRQVYWP